MNLRGSDRLRMLLMGAVATGVFGQHGSAAEPIPAPPATKKPFFHFGKPTSPPRLLPSTEAEVTIQPVARTENPRAAGTSDKKSEVMRQLELLYQQDGREMPELNTDIKPMPVAPPNAGSAAGATSPATPPASPVTSAPAGNRTQQSPPARMPQPMPQPTAKQAPGVSPDSAEPAKSKYPVMAFFKKLVSGKKDPKPTATPPDYRPDVAPVPPAVVLQPAFPLPDQTRVSTVNSQTGLPLLDGQPRTPTFGPAPSDPLPAPLASLIDVPPAPSGNRPVQTAEVDSLPPLLVDPVPAGSADAAGPPAPLESAGSDPITSPFTEMSEAEADKKMEMNPFTGLTLDEEPAKTPAQTPIEVPAVEAVPSSPPEEDPFADELEKMGLVPPAAEKTDPVKTAEPDAKLSPPTDTPTFEGIEDQATREKMKKIHERGSMKGLKGFCPVLLRDQRELVDAKPEFHSTFRGQKFHFADAESKLKFDEEPARYAPAAYGADVVALTRDKDVVEGSLDFAAWYKGRLYLFGSQESHDTFVANPATYATPVGIE